MQNIYLEIGDLKIPIGTKRNVVSASPSQSDFDSIDFQLSGSRKYTPNAKQQNRGIQHQTDFRSMLLFKIHDDYLPWMHFFYSI